MPWLGLAAVVVIAVVVLVARSAPSNSPAARAARLENQLACPVCTGESVADSNAPESRAIRADVVKRIRAGQSDAEIRDAYVAIYGEHILLTPSNGGLGVVAWGVPVVALVVGAAGIVFALRRWSITPRLAATADDDRRRRPASATVSDRRGTRRGARRVSDLDREALEAERDFLLRSLDDLEAEREAGNVDDGTYQTLHDDYTARAAAAIRSLDAGTDLTPPDPPPASTLVAQRSRSAGILAFALVAAFVLTHAVGQRHPGQTITGNGQVTGSGTTDEPGSRAGAGRRTPRAQPKSYAAQHRVRRATSSQNKRLRRRDPRVRRGRPARPEPARAADLRWLGGRAARAADQGLRRPASRCSPRRSSASTT